MTFLSTLKKCLKLDNPPPLIFTIRRNESDKIVEVYSVFNKNDHKNEKIYNLADTVRILSEYKENR